MSNLISFEGQAIPVAYMDAMRNGESPPIRDWQETPTLWQRIRSIAPFLPTGKSTWVRGLDRSKWQGNWDIQKTIDYGIRYAFIKATQNNFTDPRFDYSVNIAANANFPIGVYHFGDPYGVSAIKQAQYFCSVVKGVGELSVVLNQEWYGGLSPANLLNWMLDFFGETTVHLGDRLKEIYSTVNFLNTRVAPHDWEADGVDLWPARWNPLLEGPWSDGKFVPRDWSNWRNWQYSGDGNNMGPILGMDSDDCDTDYYHGTWEDFVAHYMPEPDPDPEPDPEIEALKERVTALENWQIDVIAWQADMIMWRNAKNAKDDEQDSRLDALEQEDPPFPDDAMLVKANQLTHYWSSARLDKACEKEPPPENDPRGKPVLEVNEGRIEQGEEVLVFKKAKFSCKDNENDPFIKASGAVYHYRSYEHPDWYIRKDEVDPVL